MTTPGSANVSNLQDTGHDKRFTAPYGESRPIPTIHKYKEIQKDREEQEEGAGHTNDHSNGTRAKLRHLFHRDEPNQGDENAQGWAGQAENRNTAESRQHDEQLQHDNVPNEKDQAIPVDTSEAIAYESDPKAKRKAMKGRDPEKDSKTRRVTDPVTHLPIEIHDFTEKELNEAPSNLPKSVSGNHSSTSLNADEEKEQEDLDSGYEGMLRLFPPPSFEAMKKESAQIYRKALIFSMAASGIPLLFVSGMTFWVIRNWHDQNLIMRSVGCSSILASGLFGCLASYISSGWLSHRIESVWDDATWESARKDERKQQKNIQIPESSMWLNFTVAAIWPLINPDLFNSLVDTLEDVMQASLPKIIRMIAVEDFGQGTSAVRILGIRSLPQGAAGKSVSKDGKIIDSKRTSNDRDNPDQNQSNNEASDTNLAEGLEAESGDFLNLEIAFSYRASTTKGKGLKEKSQNAHLYMVFYLPSNIPVPVWVALDGMVGIIRMRIQTAPDPPFINLCTLSFMGQPKASISCVPLVKKGINLMDVPFLSSFVQSSVDAALAEYVAPKSITLDLKQMLQGDDFKKDSINRGILFIKIHSASCMEGGDTKIPLIQGNSSDCYISCGWAKFSKPIWSTRIVVAEMDPSFEEHCFMLVGPGEVNAGERLRLQLWDSDRTSADDDLGRVEVDLDELMNDEKTKGKLFEREDRFVGLDGKSSKPGSIKWEVGYFEKVPITQDQFNNQSLRPEIRSLDQLKAAVEESTNRKLREAPQHVREQEASQQKKQEFYEQETALICAAPPSPDFLSGILSIQIHNAKGFEIASLRKKTREQEDEDSSGEDELPSPYCSIIINGKVVYKTRTKAKNSNPFFNAGTERFIKNWQDAEVIVSVRDSRVHEDDPLLGIIHLPLERIFSKRAQSNEAYPICGGIGYGKLRISMVFRAIEIKLPKELRGWDYGTIEIGSRITTSNLDPNLQGLRLKLSSSVNRDKMRSNGDGSWHQKRDKEIHLAVSKRYASSILIEFRTNKALKDKTSAWSILWLKDIPDDEQKELELVVWTGDQKTFERAKANVLEETGQRVGSIKVNLKFYAGLHDGHRRLKDQNIKAVMECLAVASENRDIEMDDKESDNSDTSSSDDSSEDGNDNNKSKGPIDKIKDYKEKSGTLHRQHRGLMQWKVARKANWVQSKLKDDLPHKLKDMFTRDSKGQGIETEA